MTHRGPFQPRPVCDSVIPGDEVMSPVPWEPQCILTSCIAMPAVQGLPRGDHAPPAPRPAELSLMCWSTRLLEDHLQEQTRAKLPALGAWLPPSHNTSRPGRCMSPLAVLDQARGGGAPTPLPALSPPLCCGSRPTLRRVPLGLPRPQAPGFAMGLAWKAAVGGPQATPAPMQAAGSPGSRCVAASCSKVCRRKSWKAVLQCSPSCPRRTAAHGKGTAG